MEVALPSQWKSTYTKEILFVLYNVFNRF